MMHLNIQKEQGNSLIKQIYHGVRKKILTGELKVGEKLSSTREMARVLNVSRNTVIVAYEMLIAEGYITSVPGSGVFIAEGVGLTKTPEKINDYVVSAYSAQEIEENTIGFYSGTPAIDLFPRKKWSRFASQSFKEAPVSAFGYDYPQGRPELRNTLAAYLKKTRGINCNPDQIIITSGTKQGLTLIAKCLLQSASEVWIEDPTNENVKRIFSYHTDHITPIAVDEEGIRTELFPQDRSPALIFVTPSHQFPLGGILSIKRRMELIRYAGKSGCYIVEDDYDSEFRYNGFPVSALQELDNEHVIYVGTFSKILFPSLRLGYLVLPFPLVKQCREWKRLGDHHSNSLNQLTLMRFIESGELERHIARMKKIYHMRRDDLIACLKAYFPRTVKVWGAAAGMHIVAEFAGVDFSPGLLQEIKKNGVNVIPIENHSIIGGLHKNQIILGYAHLSREEIDEGLRRLKGVLVKHGLND